MFATLIVGVIAGEFILRFKNSNMENYEIEMWRYAKELKITSSNPILSHEHIPRKEATLQSVNIRFNSLGLRGAEIPDNSSRRILFLGSSITLGWGVDEENTVTRRLEHRMRAAGQNVNVINGGVGNYNTERYVEFFLTKLTHLKPTDIVVHYFINDAENLESGGGNWFLHNSQLAVTLWIVINRFFQDGTETSLVEHYKRVYREDSPGYMAMVNALEKLKEYCYQNKINAYLVVMPDVNNLTNYPFDFVHTRMHKVSKKLGYRFVDLFPAFKTLAPEDIWAMDGDPHPNTLGHEIMSESLYPILK